MPGSVIKKGSVIGPRSFIIGKIPENSIVLEDYTKPIFPRSML